MQSSNLSIYFVIGKNPNEIFDSNLIGCYFPISNSLLLSSISRLFFDLPDQNFQVFGICQEKDFMLLQHTNNVAYCQLGNNEDEFYKISANQNIKFDLFSDLKVLFDNLISRIINDPAKNILIIFQDQVSLYNFKILLRISKVKGKNFLIYDDSCQSDSLIDMFKKNNLLFSYFQKDQKYINNKNKKKNMQIISTLYYFAKFQLFMFKGFNDCLPTFFPEFITFLSNVPEDTNLIELPFYNIIMLILDSYQIQGQSRITYFLTPINKNFFDKLQKDSNFDISTCYEMLKEFSDLDSFLSFLKTNNINNLANLMMIKLFYEFTDENTTLRDFDVFSEENYNFFLDIEKVAFEFPKSDEKGKTQRLGEFYSQVNNFFCQYYKIKWMILNFLRFH